MLGQATTEFGTMKVVGLKAQGARGLISGLAGSRGSQWQVA